MTSQIDSAVFEDLLRMTDAAFIHQLVETFLEDTPDQFSAMKAAVAAGQQEDFRRAATFGQIQCRHLRRQRAV